MIHDLLIQLTGINNTADTEVTFDLIEISDLKAGKKLR